MSATARIVEGPLPPAEAGAVGGAGAGVVFEGVVRPFEADRAIAALEYTAYRPMADRQLEALAVETESRFGLLAVLAEHSVGRVAVGRVSFRLTIRASHRREALAAMGEFIDRLKRDVPIWKSPVFA